MMFNRMSVPLMSDVCYEIHLLVCLFPQLAKPAIFLLASIYYSQQLVDCYIRLANSFPYFFIEGTHIDYMHVLFSLFNYCVSSLQKHLSLTLYLLLPSNTVKVSNTGVHTNKHTCISATVHVYMYIQYRNAKYKLSYLLYSSNSMNNTLCSFKNTTVIFP